ncbi:MAG: carboxypeptidase regulatory-like domain-containing protein [Thermoplasmatota archaeon]
MKAGGISGSLAVFLLLAIFIPAAAPVKGEVEAPTIISGTVTDSKTGNPIPGVFVAVINETKDLHFYYHTNEDGSYSFNVGTNGSFRIFVYKDSHQYEEKRVEIGLFDQVEVDFELVRYEYNVRVHFYSWDEEYPLFALEVGITDSSGNETRYLTDLDGWLKLKLDHGNYTIRSYRDFLETYEENFTISENMVFVDTADLQPANVNASAALILFHDNIYIPPGEFRTLVILDEEPTELYFYARSDVPISVAHMTQDMFDLYLEKHTGRPYPNEELPRLPYDIYIGEARGLGGGVTVWKIPYYLSFENNGMESALVSIDMRYQYGSPIVSEVIGGPLEPGSEGPVQKDLSISSIYLLLFLVIVIVMGYSLFRSHSKH